MQRQPELGTGSFGLLSGLEATMYMLDKAITGSRRYWMWLAFLLLVMAVGFVCYCWQLT